MKKNKKQNKYSSMAYEPPVMCRFLFRGVEYPYVNYIEEDYQNLVVLMPITEEEYVLGYWHSTGKFEQIDIIQANEVVIKIYT